MSLLLPALALILIGGQFAARLATRFRLPGLFGELVLGLIVGPLLVRWLGNVSMLSMLGNLGVLLLMLLVGLETDLSAFRRVGLPAFLVACCGALLPFVCGAALARWLGLPLITGLFVGVGLSATSVSITAATLRQLGQLQSRAGSTILMAAVIDDVLGLLLLAFVTGQQSGQSPVTALVRLLIIIALTIAGGLLLKPLLKLVEQHVEGFLALAVGIGLMFAWGAQAIGGLAPITGAYMAGLFLARAAPHQPLSRGIETLASGFFATIFFVSLGLDVRINTVSPTLLVLFMGLAIATKVVGCGLGALAGRLPWGEAVTVGVGMIPRGEVALIVAALGFQQKLLPTDIFSLLVLVAGGTTVITPLLLKGVYALTARGQQAATTESSTTALGEVLGTSGLISEGVD